MLPLTVSAGHIGMARYYHVPKGLHIRKIFLSFLSDREIPVQCPNKFGNRRVRVAIVQDILFPGSYLLEQSFLIKRMSRL